MVFDPPVTFKEELDDALPDVTLVVPPVLNQALFFPVLALAPTYAPTFVEAPWTTVEDLTDVFFTQLWEKAPLSLITTLPPPPSPDWQGS